MASSGWRVLKTCEQPFIVKRNFDELNFKILLSDHRRLWSAKGTFHELLQLSQSENPWCEFDKSKVTKNIFDLFDKSFELLSVSGNESSTKILRMSASIGRRPFKLSWTLSEQGPEALYEELTQPMLSMILEMVHRQNYLCDQLKEKDKEIMDYFQDHGPLKWQKKTEPFDMEEFKHSESFCKIHDHSGLVETVWNEDTLHAFNKHELSNQRKEENKVKIETPKMNEVIVKQEENQVEIESPKVNEIVKQENNATDNIPVDKCYVEIANAKNEKTDENTSQPKTRPKHKKVKLNL